MTPHASLWFVDTNVLLYRYDSVNTSKQRAAQDWLETLAARRAARLSWQVLNEFYDNATRKGGVSRAAVRAAASHFVTWEPVGFNLELIERAWYWSDHAQLRYWDALILASAETLGCRWLLTEDFQEGRKYGSVEVVNPFTAAPKAFLET
jgi:predicted nucleic acid-binding protein